MTTNGPSTDAPILVAVDFSEESRTAPMWASAQAQQEVVPLLVLHVVHDPAEYPRFCSTSDDRTFTPMLDVAEDMVQALELRVSTRAQRGTLMQKRADVGDFDNSSAMVVLRLKM